MSDFEREYELLSELLLNEQVKDRVNEVIDKISAEIENINLNEVATKYENRFYGFQQEVIKSLDKYKA